MIGIWSESEHLRGQSNFRTLVVYLGDGNEIHDYKY